MAIFRQRILATFVTKPGLTIDTEGERRKERMFPYNPFELIRVVSTICSGMPEQLKRLPGVIDFHPSTSPNLVLRIIDFNIVRILQPTGGNLAQIAKPLYYVDMVRKFRNGPKNKAQLGLPTYHYELARDLLTRFGHTRRRVTSRIKPDNMHVRAQALSHPGIQP